MVYGTARNRQTPLAGLVKNKVVGKQQDQARSRFGPGVRLSGILCCRHRYLRHKGEQFDIYGKLNAGGSSTLARWNKTKRIIVFNYMYDGLDLSIHFLPLAQCNFFRLRIRIVCL